MGNLNSLVTGNVVVASITLIDTFLLIWLLAGLRIFEELLEVDFLVWSWFFDLLLCIALSSFEVCLFKASYYV